MRPLRFCLQRPPAKSIGWRTSPDVRLRDNFVPVVYSVRMKNISLNSFSNNWPNHIEPRLRLRCAGSFVPMLIKLLLMPSLTILLSLAVMGILASAISEILRGWRR